MDFGLLNVLILASTALVVAAVVLDRWRPARAQSPEAIPPVTGESIADSSSPRTSSTPWLSTSRLRSLVSRDTRSVLTLAGAFGAGVFLLIIGQRGLVSDNVRLVSYLAWLAGLAVICVLDWEADRGAQSKSRSATGSTFPLTTWRVVLFMLIGLTSVVIWRTVPERSVTDPSHDVVLLWLLSIVALVVAATGLPSRDTYKSIRSWIAVRRIQVALLAAVVTMAAIPRLFNLSSYAWSMSGDEGTFAVTARGTLSGQMSNPFTSGPWGYPSMLFIIQGWFIDVFGDSIGSARMLSALLGIGSVVATYALIRHHFDLTTAIVAAILASAFNFHMYWSRDAQDAAAPMFFLPLALLFLDRGLVGGKQTDAMIAGLVIAIGQFFHPSVRLLIPMALAYTGYAMLLSAHRDSIRRAIPRVAPNAAWVALAIIVGHLPLIAHYRGNRTAFWSRTNEVSVFASGWLEREREITGNSSLEILLLQLQNAIMFPFSFVPHGHYRPGAPLAGWPMVAFVAIGCALATIWFLRRRYFGLALAFWVTTVGLALTNGPPMTNRYTAAAPFLAMFGAIGILAIARILVRLLGVNRRLVIVLVTASTVLIAGWHLHFYFRDPNQVELYSDSNSQIANGIAGEAEALGDGATVYLAGIPRMYYYGFQSIPYIAPEATGIDVETPWSPSMPPPSLDGPTLFAFIPERQTELNVVQTWFPNGITAEHFLPSGEHLYTSYTVEGLGITSR